MIEILKKVITGTVKYSDGTMVIGTLDNHLRILNTLFTEFENKKIKITIEVLDGKD